MTGDNSMALLPWTAYKLVSFFGTVASDQAGVGGLLPGVRPAAEAPDDVVADDAFEDLTWVFDKGENASWLGLKPGATRADIENLLRHVYSLTGHASPKEMVRILKDAGAAGPLIDVARTLECPLCLALKRPKTARSVALPIRARRFNEVVQLDIFNINVSNDGKVRTRYTLLSVMDQWSGLAQAQVLPAGTAAEVKQALQQIRVKPYGAPRVLYCDPDSVFRSEEIRRVVQRYATRDSDPHHCCRKSLAAWQGGAMAPDDEKDGAGHVEWCTEPRDLLHRRHCRSLCPYKE